MATLGTFVNRFVGVRDLVDAPPAVWTRTESPRLRPLANEDVYLFVKRIDNGAVVRVIDPAARRARSNTMATGSCPPPTTSCRASRSSTCVPTRPASRKNAPVSIPPKPTCCRTITCAPWPKASRWPNPCRSRFKLSKAHHEPTPSPAQNCQVPEINWCLTPI